MSCLPINPYVGTTQTFRYGSGGNLITVTLGAGDFRVGQGEGLLSSLGYDRTPDPDYRRSTQRGTLGNPYWQGPSFERPELFRWQLQGLTDQQYWGLLAIISRQQRDKEAVRLIDERWAFHEPSPRTRAKKGALLTPVPGMVCYYAQFDIELFEEGGRNYRADGSHELSLSARELNLVPLSEDIP